MNNFRGPSATGRSKATPQTLCQKCLKRDKWFRGMDFFECKATAQDRPYASRPSRTQQLANPKLVPKLTSDFPNELLRKKGIADEQLAKNEEARGRKRNVDENENSYGLRKPSRSMSSSSSTSVSTVSTNLSRSPHPSPNILRQKPDRIPLSSVENRKRRRSSTGSSTSYTSNSSVNTQRKDRSRDAGRNIRRRRASVSPDSRGRNRNHPRSTFDREMASGHMRRRSPSSSSLSHTSESSFESRRRDRFMDQRVSTRRHRHSISPNPRGKNGNFHAKRSNRRTRSRSGSRDRSQVARNRRSMTPGALQRNRGQRTPKLSDAVARDRGPQYANDNDRYGSSLRGPERYNPNPSHFARPSQRDRSLSPFSKRLALTQAMNMGH